MKKYIIRIALFIFLSLSPLLYYQFREYLPAYYRRPLLYEILFLTPYIFYFVTAFLGIKLNQSRIFFTSLLWAAFYYLLNMSDLLFFDFTVNEVQLVKLLAITSVLSIFLLHVFKEKYIIGLYGFLRLISDLIPTAGAVWLAKEIAPGMFPYLMENPLSFSESWHLPDLFMLLLIGLIIFLILQKDQSIRQFKYAIYLNIIPFLFTLNFSAGRGQFDFETRIFTLFSFSVMGFVFLYTLYRMYWDKVYIDELTGIPNRRAFDEHLKKLGRKYTIAMIDVDHFKQLNDTYGHTEGDNVLRFVAKHISDESGTSVFRYGGEEFSAIYKGTKIKNAFTLLDQMRENLAATAFYLRTSEDIRKSKTKKNRRVVQTKANGIQVTISIGIADKTSDKKDVHDVINSADQALYKAKENGRNRCEEAPV